MVNCRRFWGYKKINAVCGVHNCSQTHVSEKNLGTIFVNTRYVFENRKYRNKGKEVSMRKWQNKLFAIPVIALLSVSCGKSEPSDYNAEEIIDAFSHGDYEYTRISYHKIGENPKIVDEEVEGKLISNPYQQYEQTKDASDTQGISEQYWYMRDGNVVHKIKMSITDIPDNWMTVQSDVKGSDVYLKEDLTFAFDREELVSGRKVHVYRAQYEDKLTTDYSQLPEEQRNGFTEITVPYMAVIEYYIDFLEKEVVQIRIDGTDSAKAAEITNLIFSGMDQEEAEKEINDNKEIQESYESIMDIKNFNTKIEINIPED